jgi:hypothetical protein
MTMFPWLEPSVTATTATAERRLAMIRREIAQRAALFYRLGYASYDTAQRLAAYVAWEFDPPGRDGAHSRPADLDDDGIAEIVASTYARRPS